MNLIEFIYESNRSSTPDELTQSFLRFLSGHGLDRFVMSEMSYDTTSQKARKHGMLVNYPAEWMNHYIANNYLEYDPVYQTALSSRKPFTWKAVQEEKAITKQSKLVMDEAKENKLYNGIGLSIYQPLGMIIGMGFASSEKEIDCNRDTLSAVHAAANQFFTVYADLVELNTLKNSDISLTTREQEVLLWLARGKSKPVISDILEISESTVKRHSENIFSKLQANNIPMAVTKALRIGLIKPY
jgi:LuxR family quorum sensing-dependent transcriptional regulator